jgi:branched-chain amino acid transport system permease protein
METFIQSLLSGFLLGGLYALIGLGMTLIMGVMKIINLAHGEIMMVSMYIAWWLFTTFHIDPYLSIVIITPIVFILGMLIQHFFIQPVIKVESILPENQVILTVGIGMVLTNIITLIFKSDYRSTPVSYATDAWYLKDFWKNSPWDISLSFVWSVSFLTAVFITILLWFFLHKTDIGRSIRATSQDYDAARIVGISTTKMRLITFGLGSALVGIAGCLFIPMYYLFPSIGGQFTLIAFVITILGGLGSTTGAILGGIFLGIFESLTATYLGMGWAPVGRFIIFILSLIFLPNGIASLLQKRKLS